jgi:hypothetical protein
MTNRHALSSVRIYWDSDALAVDQFGKNEGFELKALHDQLFQTALDSKLATALVFMDWKRPWKDLASAITVAAERPRWWPCGRSRKNRQDLLQVPVQAFGKSWQRVRADAESKPKRAAFWHDDPALVFSTESGALLCRTASVGHEGQVFYFVYAKERAWEDAILGSSLPLFGQGEQAYRKVIVEPGKIAGW